MATDVAYDDDLDLSEEEQQRRRPQGPPAPIGQPIEPRAPIEPETVPAGTTLAPPTQEPVGQPLNLQPQTTPRPAYERYEALSAKGQKPWGDLGVGGKIGRVAETIGTAINPNVVAAIPGTEPNRQRQLHGARTAAGEESKEIASQSEEGLRAAEAERNRATAEAALHPPVKPKEEVWKAVPGVIGPGGKILQEEQNSGQMRWAPDVAGAEPLKPPTEKTPPHITAMLNGKAHIMERDTQTGAYTIDRGEAPPNYAQTAPQTHTTELLGADNVMHRFQFNPETKTYDIDLGPAPTGTAAHQIFQAGAIEELAPQVIADINANRDILGNLASYYKQWTTGTPVSDPRAAKMMAELMSLAAMQPALHAFRSTNALDAFEKLIGQLAKDPDATIATIEGLMKTPQAFTNVPKRNTPPSGGGGQHQKGDTRTNRRTGEEQQWDGQKWQTTKPPKQQ